jgi:hypothetical protein
MVKNALPPPPEIPEKIEMEFVVPVGPGTELIHAFGMYRSIWGDRRESDSIFWQAVTETEIVNPYPGLIILSEYREGAHGESAVVVQHDYQYDRYGSFLSVFFFDGEPKVRFGDLVEYETPLAITDPEGYINYMVLAFKSNFGDGKVQINKYHNLRYEGIKFSNEVELMDPEMFFSLPPADNTPDMGLGELMPW